MVRALHRRDQEAGLDLLTAIETQRWPFVVLTVIVLAVLFLRGRRVVSREPRQARGVFWTFFAIFVGGGCVMLWFFASGRLQL